MFPTRPLGLMVASPSFAGAMIFESVNQAVSRSPKASGVMSM